MLAGCNCGPNSLLARTLSCHCVRRGTSHCQSAATSEVVKEPLFRIVSGAISSELALPLPFIRNLTADCYAKTTREFTLPEDTAG